MEKTLFNFLARYIELTEEEKAAILSLDVFRSVKKGTILLREGQNSKESYFVLKGCLRTYYLIDSEEKTTAFHTEMEAVTPNCVVTQSPSEYFIQCVEDCILVVSDRDTEEETFQKFPRFESLCRTFSEETVVKQQMDFDRFRTSTPEQRYLYVLESRPDLIQRVPLHQLASFLGIQPQSLSRLRSRLLEKSRISLAS